jgi:hypothetical protein
LVIIGTNGNEILQILTIQKLGIFNIIKKEGLGFFEDIA